MTTNKAVIAEMGQRVTVEKQEPLAGRFLRL